MTKNTTTTNTNTTTTTATRLTMSPMRRRRSVAFSGIAALLTRRSAKWPDCERVYLASQDDFEIALAGCNLSGCIGITRSSCKPMLLVCSQLAAFIETLATAWFS